MPFFLNALGRTIANEKTATNIVEYFKDSFSLRYNWSTWICESAYVCTALPAMQSVVVDFVTVIFLRTNDLPLENKVPALSWKLYTHVLQPKLHVIICCNVRLMYYPSTPILNPPHTPKRQYNSKVKSNRLLYMPIIIMLS